MPHFIKLSLIVLISTVSLSWAAPSGDAPQIISPAEIAQATKKYGLLAGRRLEAWQELVDKYHNKPERLKLQRVNEFFNEARFISDIKH